MSPILKNNTIPHPVYWCSLFWLPQYEVWKPIVDYETTHEVSNYGRARAFQRTVATKRKSGTFLYVLKERMLAISNNGKGYYFIRLGKGVQKYIHRAVAQAFIPNENNLSDVNHKKGIKSDNRASELEWVSHADNQKHAGENALMARGERVHGATLTKETVIEIFNAAGKYKDIAKDFKILPGQVSKIKRKIRWKHLHKQI